MRSCHKMEASVSSPLELTALEICTKMRNLELPPDRRPCSRCNKRSQYYCGDCCTSVVPELSTPLVHLPLTLDVLRGAEEAGNKSTASHAPVLAEPVRLFKLGTDFPSYPDPKRVLLLYPSPTSVAVSDLPDLTAFDYLAVVDTTWVKVGRVFQMPELTAPFTHVHLGSYKTLFWRHQPLGPQCVSSIESVYFFFREWEIEAAKRSLLSAGHPLPTDLSTLYDGRHDNLLLLFMQQYKRIQAEYAGSSKVVTRHIASQLSSSAPQTVAMLARATRGGTGGTGGTGGGEEGSGGQQREAGAESEGDSTALLASLQPGASNDNSSSTRRKRPRVKGAWCVAPHVLGQAAAPVAGAEARVEYASSHFHGMASKEALADPTVAAVMQFEHIRTSNRHVYGTLVRADKEIGFEAKQAAMAALAQAQAAKGAAAEEQHE